VFLNKIA
jgi:hypothetical protein